MYDVSAQGIDERMINVHYYYCYYYYYFKYCLSLLLCDKLKNEATFRSEVTDALVWIKIHPRTFVFLIWLHSTCSRMTLEEHARCV